MKHKNFRVIDTHQRSCLSAAREDFYAELQDCPSFCGVKKNNKKYTHDNIKMNT